MTLHDFLDCKREKSTNLSNFKDFTTLIFLKLWDFGFLFVLLCELCL